MGHLKLKVVVVAAALALGGGAAEAKKLIRGSVGKAASHVSGEVRKTVSHAGKELKNGVENTGEAIVVAGKTVDRQQRATREALGNAGERLKDGKIVDAAWHFQTDQWKATEKNTLRATQESSMLRMGGQMAATAYGGPAGGAAFQTWQVGRTTGDVGKGLKAGAISYASSAASGAVSAPAATTGGQVAAKAAANAAISGTTVAASGGDFREGALQGAVTSVANDGYRAYTGHAPDPRPGDKAAVPKGASAAECAGVAGCKVVDSADAMRKIDPRVNNIGKATTTPGASGAAFEGSGFMRGVNKLAPGSNAMAYGHDILATQFKLGTVTNAATIAPAVVATYTALGANKDQALAKAATESEEGNKR